MLTETLVRMTYWGGWVSAAVALVYKLLFTLGMAMTFYQATAIQPRHFWQLSFLLFIVCIASAHVAEAKTS